MSLPGILRRLPLYRQAADYWKRRRFLRLRADDRRWADFYRQFVKPGQLVFDVGANMGKRTKVFLALGARVVAFEPQKMCADFLKSMFGAEKRFRLIESALGANEGDADLLVSDAHTLSTLSPQWVQATQASGRFSQHHWAETQRVRVTTLDRVMSDVGVPSFIKIDVEGYESSVLLGLTQPVGCISIEFAAENIENAFRCIDYADSRWAMLFQFSAEESAAFQFPGWVTAAEIRNALLGLIATDKLAWGDIYMKCADRTPVAAASGAVK